MIKAKLNPMVLEDKMCRSKRRYEGILDLARAANRLSCGKPKLYGYECPFCRGFHLTKFQKPINPSLKDRINIDLSQVGSLGMRDRWYNPNVDVPAIQHPGVEWQPVKKHAR